MAAKPIRAFIAIKIPKNYLSQIEVVIDDLKNKIDLGVKWVRTDLMHITLKFFANFDPDHIDLLKSELNKKTEDFKVFPLTINKIGVYPNMYQTRVAWLGFSDPSQIIGIHKVIQKTASQFGYEPERRKFSPHLTIGRVRNNISRLEKEQIGKTIVNYQIPKFNSFMCNQISFIKSELKPDGPIYSSLFEIDFK